MASLLAFAHSHGALLAVWALGMVLGIGFILAARAERRRIMEERSRRGSTVQKESASEKVVRHQFAEVRVPEDTVKSRIQ